jgi:glycosyltransferase involved in cell wall biosynthesis
MARVRILHLLTAPTFGGAETNLLNLIRHFQRERYEHWVAFGGNGELEVKFREAGARVVRLSDRPLALRSVLELRSMIRRIAEWAPAVIHSHLDLPNIAGIAAAHALGCRLILHLHGSAILPSRLLGRGVAHRVWNLAARSYRYCDLVIAICAFQLPFIDRLGVDSNRVQLIPNGVDLNGFPRVTGERRNGHEFVHVGRFFPDKDHALLIRAFREVSRAIPSARLTLVGDGPLRIAVERQVVSERLVGKVRFLGTRHDVPEILADQDCLILCSRSELHPITVLEAMRAGLPVIASRVGGIPETVVDGTTGLLITPGSEIELAGAMCKMARDRSLGSKLGRCGYQHVQGQFSNVLVAKQIEAAYERVLLDGRRL